MIYDSCLLVTAFLYAWIGGDLLFSRQPRHFPCIGVAALAVSAWSLGEILARHATTPEGLIEARRLLFLGVCLLGPAWFVGASHATRARWIVVRPWLGMYLFAPGSLAYASLSLGSGHFVDTSGPETVRGPLFLWHALYSWSLVFAGFVLVSRHLAALGSGWRMHTSLGAAAGIPFVTNVVYVTTGMPGPDPTPLVLGAVALALRFLLLETALAPDVQTLARHELLDQLGVGFVVADAFGRVVEANPAARELTGLDDPTGAAIDDVVELARHHPLRTIEVETSVLERSGIRFGTAAVLEDRTEVRTAERRLELATRFEALGFLISGVTHQISNPLSYVRGNLGLLDRLVKAIRQEPEILERLPPQARRVAREGEAIVRDTIAGADRITLLVRRLGTFARDEARRPPAPVDLSMVAHQAADLAGLGRAPDQIRIRQQEGLPLVFTREQDVLQILLHLLINAIQAEGKDAVIEIELASGDDEVSVWVLDRGPGIAPGHLAHVFDPFFTTKDGHANQGLGLSLSYDLARQNGGLLEVYPREGGGAAFVLRLPLRRPDASLD